MIEDPDAKVSIVHVPTAGQKANLFTKAVLPAAFEKERELIGVVSPQ